MKNRILKSIAVAMAAVFIYTAFSLETLSPLCIGLSAFSGCWLALFIHVNKERFNRGAGW
jgi:hypothetical protein